MPWPAANLSERWVDWSWYNNRGRWTLPPYKPFDVDAFCAAHPEVHGAVIRAVWPNGSKDKHYDYYFDGFTRNDKRVAAYCWPNPQKAVYLVMEDWKRALGERMPKIIGQDYEEASTFVGKSKAQITTTMQQTVAAARIEFTQSETLVYARGSWLDQWIMPGDWLYDISFWLAHWIYPPPDYRDAAAHWSEVETVLPISNNFTPSRGRIVKIPVENVKGWQFSSSGEIVPRGRSDMDFFLKSYIEPIYDGAEPPEPPAEKLAIELRVPAGKVDVTVREI